MSLPQTQKIIQGDQNGEPVLLEVPVPKPSQNEVLVKIEYAPVHPYDLMILKGYHGGNKLVGSEGSGVVVAVGENLKYSHKIGDKVHVIGLGTYAQYMIAKSEKVFPILHKDLSFEDSATHYVNPATVHGMAYLAEKGGHKAAVQTVGSSVLGRMFIRYFKLKGIKTINIVRKDEYIEELKKEGADYVLNSQDQDFEEKLKEITAKENATIAFDAICGNFTNKVLTALPPKSTLYIYGLLDGDKIKEISVPALFQRKSIACHVVTHYLEDADEQKYQKIFNDIHTLLPDVFNSKILKVFPMEQINEGFAYFKTNKSIGKILIKPN